MFDYILSSVGPLIQRRHTNYRKCIRAHDRLAITLAYLTTGSLFKVIRNSYFVSKSSISKIIAETCAAIIHCFQDELKIPNGSGVPSRTCLMTVGIFHMFLAPLMASIYA